MNLIQYQLLFLLLLLGGVFWACVLQCHVQKLRKQLLKKAAITELHEVPEIFLVLSRKNIITVHKPI